MKNFVLILIVAAIAGGAGWFFGHEHSAAPQPATNGTGRKVLFYQSPMHPWIKSDKPGNCTICGMKLAPVFEGDQPRSVAENIVQLSSNSVTVLHVQTSEIVERPLKRSIRTAGIIEDDDTKHRIISAYVGGRIDELHVNFVGAEVAKGAPLVTFYSPDLLAAEREYITLLPEKNMAHLTQPDAHHPLLNSAALRLKRLGLTDAQIGELPKKPAEVQHSEIVAPVSGTIVARHVYPGQYVQEGEKLFEIGDFSTMWLQLNVYERDLPWIRTGQVVRVTTPAHPGRVFGGRVAFINPTLDEMTRSAIIRVVLDNPVVEVDGQKRRLLFHKLYADAAIEAETAPLLAVDRAAVLNPGGKPAVYVELGGGGYEQRAVKLGRRGDDGWEILDGLTAGEKVVTEGNLMIDSQSQIAHSAGHDHEGHL